MEPMYYIGLHRYAHSSGFAKSLVIDELSKAIEQEAAQRPEVQLLMTHPGVGPITALAFVLIIGTPERFHCGRQIASYLGLIPCEESSADHYPTPSATSAITLSCRRTVRREGCCGVVSAMAIFQQSTARLAPV